MQLQAMRALVFDKSQVGVQFRSTTFTTLTHRLLTQAIPEEVSKFKIVPFDLYYLSIKKKLDNGICTICGKYWPREAAIKTHRKAHTKWQNVDLENKAETDGNENDEIDERGNQEGAETRKYACI